MPHVYDLSFTTTLTEGTKRPAIVFEFRKDIFELLTAKIAPLLHADIAAAQVYLEQDRFDKERIVDATDFKLCERDLFGTIAFGHGGCGAVTYEGDVVRVAVELSLYRRSEAALTIRTLARLPYLATLEHSTNRQQQVELETTCEHARHGGYGHWVGGYIAPVLITWLRRKGKEGAQPPPEVLAAMRTAWKAVSPPLLKKYAKECAGQINQNGTFFLSCFGNACDIALYPDMLTLGDEAHVRFGCHNLDSVGQQLTLVAGLAKMCELARRETT